MEQTCSTCDKTAKIVLTSLKGSICWNCGNRLTRSGEKTYQCGKKCDGLYWSVEWESPNTGKCQVLQEDDECTRCGSRNDAEIEHSVMAL